MDQRRVTLDNIAFQGRLRHTSRSPAYVSRPTPRPAQTIQDVSRVGYVKLQPLQKPLPNVSSVDGFRMVRQQAKLAAVRPKPLAQSAPIVTQKPVAVHAPQVQAKPHQPQKSAVLHRAAVRPSNKQETEQPKPAKRRKQTIVLYAMAGVLFIAGAAVSLNGLRTNRQVAAQVEHLAAASTASDGSDNGGTPTTDKPSDGAVSSYAVAPNLPRYIDIPKLSVHARVLSMSVTKEGQLKAPGNVYDAGWYNASAQPGQPGAMLIDGHVSSWTTNGVFYKLDKLVAGDVITITRGDGKTFNYRVVASKQFDADKVDMASLLVSSDTSKPGLNLITCSGKVKSGTNEFDKRLAVYTVLE